MTGKLKRPRPEDRPPYRRWRPDEVKFLQDNFSNTAIPIETLARRLNRHPSNLYVKAFHLGLKRKDSKLFLPDNWELAYEPGLVLGAIAEDMHDEHLAQYNRLLRSWTIAGEGMETVDICYRYTKHGEMFTVNGEWLVTADKKRTLNNWSYASWLSSRYEMNVAVASNRNSMLEEDGRITIEFSDGIIFRRHPLGTHTNYWIMRPGLDFGAMARMYGRRRE